MFISLVDQPKGVFDCGGAGSHLVHSIVEMGGQCYDASFKRVQFFNMAAPMIQVKMANFDF